MKVNNRLILKVIGILVFFVPAWAVIVYTLPMVKLIVAISIIRLPWLWAGIAMAIIGVLAFLVIELVMLFYIGASIVLVFNVVTGNDIYLSDVVYSLRHLHFPEQRSKK